MKKTIAEMRAREVERLTERTNDYGTAKKPYESLLQTRGSVDSPSVP